jgi:P4 family phage/plasmid primase-like protien
MSEISNNKSLKNLYEYLKMFIIEKDSDKEVTHTCCGPPYGSYNIPISKLEKFYKLYIKAIIDGHNLHITESRKKTSPIVIDLDFKQNLKHNKRFYTEENIKKVINLFNMRIEKYIDIPHHKLQAFVFEKKEPVNRSNKINDGIHIIYPYICINTDLIHIIRASIIKKIESKKYFQNIPHQNSLEDVFDKGVIDKTNWCLYGSSKPNNHPYKLTKIYGYDLSELDIDEYKQSDLPELLSVRKYSDRDILPLKDSVDIKILKDKILDLNGKNNEIQKKINDDIQKEIVIDNIINNSSKEDIETAKILTNLLSSDRSSNYNDWIRVGWCLFNIDNSLLNNWIEFSKRTTENKQFKEGECEKLWKTFKKKDLGLGSLYHWAKDDNLDGFLEYKKQKISKIIGQSVNGTPYDVAVVLHEMYQDVYVCASLKNKTWYQFENHKWVEIDEGHTLRKKISTEIVNEYSKLGSELYIQVGQAEGVEKEALLKKIGMLHKIINDLKRTGFKKDIMAECRDLFYNKYFLEKIDENRDLLCFKNGVYDLENNYFRNGTPDDYLTLCTNINYIPYDEDDDNIKETYNFFRQLQPNEEMNMYVLTLLASYLHGHTPDEKFHLWTGSGSNGKSKSIELVQMAFGDYAGTLPIALLTQKRSASGTATPEMAMTKGKRFCVFQEPEETDKIRVGLMKELTGGDKIMARQLFKEPIEFIPQFKLLLTCNKLPYIPSNDGGTWRRLRVVEFGSKFVDKPKAPNEFKKDAYLKLKFEMWKEAFMAILIHIFAEYKKNGLVEPKEVTKFTDKYQESSDVYLEFLNESIEKTDDKNDYLTINAMYCIFKSWFKEGYSDRKAPGKREFKDYIVEKYKDSVKDNNVYGLSYASNNDDVIKNLENNL